LLDRLAECAERGGDATAAVQWSRLRCALTPLDELAHCALLRRLAIAGDRAGALATGRAFAQRLRTELGVAPGPPIRAVLAQLRGPTIAASPKFLDHGQLKLPLTRAGSETDSFLLSTTATCGNWRHGR
jgi:DNA-binding SARP family transcriptional activator